MKYILLNTWDFFEFLLRDLFSLIFLFKLYEFGRFYTKDSKTGYRVKGYNCYGCHVFYKSKWSAFFGINKYHGNTNGYLGYFKM